MSDSAWKVFHLPELLKQVGGDEPCHLEYLRMPGLSSGVYQLPAGAKDMRAPHLEDEINFVIEDKARLMIAEQEQEVAPVRSYMCRPPPTIHFSISRKTSRCWHFLVRSGPLMYSRSRRIQTVTGACASGVALRTAARSVP